MLLLQFGEEKGRGGPDRTLGVRPGLRVVHGPGGEYEPVGWGRPRGEGRAPPFLVVRPAVAAAGLAVALAAVTLHRLLGLLRLLLAALLAGLPVALDLV